MTPGGGVSAAPATAQKSEPTVIATQTSSRPRFSRHLVKDLGCDMTELSPCDRVPGVPYKPARFDTVSEALDAAELITAVLCPRPGTNQEIYFNTDNFHK